MYENLSENLITLRKSRNYTQAQLADILKYSDKSVSKWETGESLPNLETLVAISELYGISVDDLLKTKVNGENVAEEEVVRTVSKRVITLLAITSVWFIAISIFSIFLIENDGKANGGWMSFIWAVTICSVLLIIFSALWARKYIYASISLFTWSLITSFYLQFLVASNFKNNFFTLFIMGVPLQVTIILTRFLKKDVTKSIAQKNKEKKLKKLEKQEPKEE